MFQRLESLSMSKSAITRLFKVAVAFVVAGSITGAAVVIIALTNGAITFGAAQFVTLDPGAIAGAIAGLAVASLLTAIGTVAAVVSWAGALLNTSRLEDKAWFATILVLGIVSLGWVAMIAYILKGPDSSSARSNAGRALA
jgi:hypothetical protein